MNETAVNWNLIINEVQTFLICGGSLWLVRKGKAKQEDDADKQRPTFWEGLKITESIGSLGWLCVYGGFAILLYRVYYWLKYGRFWFDFPVRKVLPNDLIEWVKKMDWVGIKKILLFIFDSDVMFVCFGLGIVLVVISGGKSLRD